MIAIHLVWLGKGKECPASLWSSLSNILVRAVQDQVFRCWKVIGKDWPVY